MELKLLLKLVRRRWWLVAVPLALVAAFVAPDLLPDGTATTGGHTVTFRYTAGQERGAFDGLEGDLQDVWEASFKLVEAIAAWTRTGTFRAEIAGTLDSPDDIGGLAIVSDSARAIGQITLGWPGTADELNDITRAVIAALQAGHADYFAPQLGGQPAQIILLDDPHIVAAPPPLTNRFAPFLRLGVALFLGLALVFFADYMDSSVREREDLRRLGVPVVGDIPR
ncbi:MAG: hypothetical protein EA396_03260 [Anaerolineaceae bacterium]|nr:MAG: hypothetical protein EA396_03260 [Anaerolineaceae bacterium]